MTRAQLRKLRKTHGLSAAQLAKMMGVCRRTALNYAAGATPIKESAAAQLLKNLEEANKIVALVQK